MAVRRVRFNVGSKRLTAGTHPGQASYTRAIRSQMKQVEGNYRRAVEMLRTNTPEAMRQMLQPVFDRSQVLVPFKTGALKASGYIEIRRRNKDVVVGEVGYGKGGKPPYAVFVHENLDAHHAAPTQAKFLEQAADENINDMLDQAGHVYNETLGL